MITREQVTTLIGRDVYDRDGDKIGTVGQVWADAAGMPTWASVRTGLFGTNESLVPLQDADLQGDRLTVAYEKSTVKDTPNIDASHDEPLSEDEVNRLYQHYGMSWEDSYRADQAGAAHAPDATTTTSSADTESRPAGAVGRDTSATSDEAMTRSEERLKVGAEREQVGRARLRKYVVTEQQQVTVPVQREQARLEREPITEANRDAAYRGPELTESEHEVTLSAERPVVEKETVPVERVRLDTKTVTEQQPVTEEVRKEQIEVKPPDQGRRDPD